MADPDTERAATTSEQQRVEEIAGFHALGRRTALGRAIRGFGEWTISACRDGSHHGLWHGEKLTPLGLAVQAHLRAKEGV